MQPHSRFQKILLPKKYSVDFSIVKVMKKIKILIPVITIAVVMSSCDCFFMWVFSGFESGCFDGGLGNSLIGAIFKELPVTPLPDSDNGGEEENARSSFTDIIGKPTFTLGPSMSWLGGDKEEGEKFPALPGFQLGAFWQVPLANGLNLQPGLQYANRGVGYKMEESGVYEPGVPGGYSYNYEQRKKLHYLELPVLVNGQVTNNLGLFGGPQLGFLLGAKVVNKSNGETTSTEKGTKGFNKVDFGLTAGAAYQIPNTFFNVSLSYYHGFSNLMSGSEYGGYGYDEPKYFTRGARLGVQYNFGQARKHASAASKNSFRSWMGKQ